MCQLLAINSSSLSDFRLSFHPFCRRGGCTDVHAHGWGLAVYEGRGLRTFLDRHPCCQSTVAEFIEHYPMLTCNMMAHIRYATQGSATLENTHPFNREMWGVNFCFAHNGVVPVFSNFSRVHPDHHPLLGKSKRGELSYHAVGDTDSEAVFCAILNALKAEFCSCLPTLPLLFETLKRLCENIIEGRDEETIFNFLLGCGEYTMFAYSWPGSRPPSPVWNGLHYIVRERTAEQEELLHTDYSINFPTSTVSQQHLNSNNNKVAVIATQPLTNEDGWVEMKRGELLMFDRGQKYATAEECRTVEIEGHGLFSKCIPHSGHQQAAESLEERPGVCSECRR